jgi:hypothetical protein
MATRKKKLTVTAAGQLTMFNAPGSLVVIKPPSPEEIALALSQAQAAVAELQSEAEALIITDQLSYTKADALLDRVRNGEKVVEEKFQPIISPLRIPLDEFYELRRGVAIPLEATKLLVKTKMGAHQLEEKKRLDAEAAENLRKAKEIAAKFQTSGFPPQPPNLGIIPTLVAREAEQAGAITQQAIVTYLAPPTAPAPSAAHSSARFERRFRTTDLDLLVDAALAGEVPLDILTVRPSKLQEYFDRDPELVASWPGVEVYDHPIITGR